MYVCMYERMYVCMYVCMYVLSIYIYTHQRGREREIYIYISKSCKYLSFIYTGVKVRCAQNTLQRHRVDGADNGKTKCEK